MIDVESIWTSESWLENYQALKTAFYNVMCNREPWTIEEVRELDDKHYFAFYCEKCEQMHAEHRRVWAVVASTLTTNTPPEDHPEYEEYRIRRQGFMRQVKHIDVRDFAEPFLRTSVEGQFIDGAILFHQQAMDDFHEFVCNSTVELGTSNESMVAAYFCSAHDTTHYLSLPDSNFYRRQISGSKIGPQFLEFLSPLGQRIVLREINAAYRKFDAIHPWEKIQNKVAVKKKEKQAKQRAEERAERQRLHSEMEAAARARKEANIKKQQIQDEEAAKKKAENQRRHAEEQVEALLRKKAKKAEKAKEIQKAAKGRKKRSKSKNRMFRRKKNSATAGSQASDSNLYILAPNLMSEDWLIEYQVCGRKVAIPTFEEAQAWKTQRLSELKSGYDIYSCPYCSNWHWGRKSSSEVTPKHQARRGMFWYKRDHKKANIFIHRIMFEDFSAN